MASGNMGKPLSQVVGRPTALRALCAKCDALNLRRVVRQVLRVAKRDNDNRVASARVQEDADVNLRWVAP